MPTTAKTRLTSMPAHQEVKDGLEERFREAWDVAFRAAHLLKHSYGARQVLVTGSLLRRDRFHAESDIDLVVENFGMAEAFDSQKGLEQFYPWPIDVIPVQSLPSPRREYILDRSVYLDTGT